MSRAWVRPPGGTEMTQTESGGSGRGAPALPTSGPMTDQRSRPISSRAFWGSKKSWASISEIVSSVTVRAEHADNPAGSTMSADGPPHPRAAIGRLGVRQGSNGPHDVLVVGFANLAAGAIAIGEEQARG